MRGLPEHDLRDRLDALMTLVTVGGSVDNLLRGCVDPMRGPRGVRLHLVEQRREVGAHEALRLLGAVASNGSRRSGTFGPGFPDSRSCGDDRVLAIVAALLRDRLAPSGASLKRDQFGTQSRHVASSGALVVVDLRDLRFGLALGIDETCEFGSHLTAWPVRDELGQPVCVHASIVAAWLGTIFSRCR